METSAFDARDEADARRSRLNSWVAITVALLATFMGISKVKDDNIVQAMQQAQADKLDHWSFYQARNIREEIARSARTTLELQGTSAPAARRAGIDSAIARYRALEADQATKKRGLQAQAEQDQRTYDALNYRDDQFDLADAALAIAISLLAITSLTQKQWLYWLAMVPTGLGILMGLAGLLGWHLHPDTIARLLS